VHDAEGNVTGFEDVLVSTPSHKLNRDAAATVKSVTTKSGNLKLDVHDKIAALNSLAKITGMLADATPANLTVNQLNVSQSPDTALELARKLAFAIAAAEHATQRSPPGPLIEGEKVAPARRSNRPELSI
jgi:hypothetical protein